MSVPPVRVTHAPQKPSQCERRRPYSASARKTPNAPDQAKRVVSAVSNRAVVSAARPAMEKVRRMKPKPAEARSPTIK